MGKITKRHLRRIPHPRNIYREKPNIKELTMQFPELRMFAIQGLDGRVTINFKDKEALRTLTKVLLKKDFDLVVDIPPDRLVPTLPLRLNYLLWIEDLLVNSHQEPSSNVYGIDIGTGASCIYALLAARKNNYKMLATEVDDTSFKYASDNVRANNLEQLVTVKKVSKDIFLCGILESEVTYDFCMCNPPFFTNQDRTNVDLNYQEENKISDSNGISGVKSVMKVKDRTGHRMPPKNAPTGSEIELSAPGGEVAFIENLINDSVILKDRIKVYTSMVGHKSNVDKLLTRLLKSIGIIEDCINVTSFYQGNVTRWAIAWTFHYNLKLSTGDSEQNFPLLNKRKKPLKLPVEHVFENTTMDECIMRVRYLLSRIQIMKRVIEKKGNEYSLEIKSYEETWKNQRKRRRQEDRDKVKVEIEMKNEVMKGDTSSASASGTMILEKGKECVDNDSKFYQSTADCLGNIQLQHDGVNDDNNVNNSSHNSQTTNETPSYLQSIVTQYERPLVLEALILLKKHKHNVLLEMSSIGGKGGWNAVHQVLTYLKNHWHRNL